MLREIADKKNSVIFAWLISYITILIIPISINYFIYFQTKKTLEDEVIKTNLLVLGQVRQNIDGIVERAKLMGEEISLNPRMNALIAMDRNDNTMEFEIFKIRQDLSMYASSKYFLKRFFIVLNNMDLVINSEICCDSQTFFNDYLVSDITTEQWAQILSIRTAGNFISSDRFEASGKSGIIPYVKTLQPLGSYGNKATLVIMMDESEFLDSVKQIREIDESIALICDKDRNIIASTQEGGFHYAIPYETMLEEQGYLHETLGKDKVVISYISSKEENWKCVFVTPMQAIWKKVGYMNKSLIYGIFLSVLIGIFMISYYLKRRYSPIGKIMKIFDGDYKLPTGTDTNEYSFIEQVITSTLQENKKNLNTIEEQKKFITDVFLSKLLKGTIDNYNTIETTLSSCNIYFKSEYFSVIVFNVEDYGQLFPDEKELTLAQRRNLTVYILKNVIEELASKNNQGIMVEMDDMLACLINYSESTVSESREDMIRIAEEALNFLSEQFNIRIIAAVSKVHETFVGVSKAYQEALQAMEHNMLTGVSDISEYEDVMQTNPYIYNYPLEMEQRLINFIKAGNFIGSKTIIDEIFNYDYGKDNLSVKVTRCLMFDVAGTVLKTITEISNVLGNGFFEELNLIENLLNNNSINDMKKIILYFLEKVCERIQSQGNDHNFMRRVVDYIMENYADYNLSVTKIGNRFSLTPSYLSLLFKEKMGESILDYISKLRIDKAKQLLINTSFNLEDIAEQVGYTNKVTFTRLFKKYEGITPGRYREIEEPPDSEGT